VLAIVATASTVIAVLQTRGADRAAVAPEIPVATPAPTEEPGPETSAAPPPPAPVPQRLLVAGDEPGHLLRASIGECPAPAGTVEVSFDDGETWQPGSADDVVAARILQFDLSDPEITRMVSLDRSDCAPQVSRSFVGGTAWEREDPPADFWYLDPEDPAVVHAPAGEASLPCSAVALSSDADRAIVLCADSQVTVSTDSGATWSRPQSVPYAASVGLSPIAFIVASNGGPECAGVRLQIVTPTELGVVSSCLETTADSSRIAIAASLGTVSVWADDEFFRSYDEGQSWR